MKYILFFFLLLVGCDREEPLPDVLPSEPQTIPWQVMNNYSILCRVEDDTLTKVTFFFYSLDPGLVPDVFRVESDYPLLWHYAPPSLTPSSHGYEVRVQMFIPDPYQSIPNVREHFTVYTRNDLSARAILWALFTHSDCEYEDCFEFYGDQWWEDCFDSIRLYSVGSGFCTFTWQDSTHDFSAYFELRDLTWYLDELIVEAHH